MTSSADSRHGATGRAFGFAAFFLPFLIQILVLPGWALGRLQAAPPVAFPALLLGAGWPLLLVPAFAAVSTVCWRLEPRNATRLNVFAGAAAGAVCTTLFFIVSVAT